VTRDYRDFLDDMLADARQAQAFVGEMDWAAFQTDTKTCFATARRIFEDVPQCYADIPWRRIIGKRNGLAQHYDGADLRIVYDTATVFPPGLIARLAAVMANLDDAE
jgi:uncharacterized protein with HEPN domain